MELYNYDHKPIKLDRNSVDFIKKIEDLGIVSTLSGNLNLDSQGLDYTPGLYTIFVWATDRKASRPFEKVLVATAADHRPGLRLQAIFRDAGDSNRWINADAQANVNHPRDYRLIIFFEGKFHDAYDLHPKPKTEIEKELLDSRLPEINS